MADTVRGVGDFFDDEIVAWTGENLRTDATHLEWISKMNAWGVQGCRQQLSKILQYFRALKEEKKWANLPSPVPGATQPLKAAVLRAIWEVEIRQPAPAANARAVLNRAAAAKSAAPPAAALGPPPTQPVAPAPATAAPGTPPATPIVSPAG